MLRRTQLLLGSANAQKRRRASWQDAKSLARGKKEGKSSGTKQGKLAGVAGEVLGITGAGASSRAAQASGLSLDRVAQHSEAGRDRRAHGDLNLLPAGSSFGKFLYADIPLACNGFCPVAAARPMGHLRISDRSLGLIQYAGLHFGFSSPSAGHDFAANPDTYAALH